MPDMPHPVHLFIPLVALGRKGPPPKTFDLILRGQQRLYEGHRAGIRGLGCRFHGHIWTSSLSISRRVCGAFFVHHRGERECVLEGHHS